MQQEENLDSRRQLDEADEYTSGGDPSRLYKILRLLFFLWYEFFVHHALRVEKIISMLLMWGLWNFSFFGRGDVFRTLSLCFGVIGKIPGIISHNNFVKKNLFCIGHCNKILARCDSIFPLLRCQGVWKKTCTQLSLSQILFQNPKNYSLGDVKDSAIILDKIRRSFLPNRPHQQYFTSLRVDFGRPFLVIFYQLPSVLKPSIPPTNL